MCVVYSYGFWVLVFRSGALVICVVLGLGFRAQASFLVLRFRVWDLGLRFLGLRFWVSRFGVDFMDEIYNLLFLIVTSDCDVFTCFALLF